MCGRYTLIDNNGELVERFQVTLWTPGFEAHPDYNVAPTRVMPIIRREEGQHAERPMRWGFVPVWAKDEQFGFKTINARAEGVADKPTYRSAFRHQQCLVPASGFFEWQQQGSAKQPSSISRKDSDLLTPRQRMGDTSRSRC